MKAIFRCFEEEVKKKKLEIETQTHNAKVTVKNGSSEDISIVLDKKSIVGLIQVLAEVLIEIE